MSEAVDIPEEILTRLKAIQIRTNHFVNDVFAGEYVSAFKGRGMEFEEVRDYFPGDDVRDIDWNVTARAGKPYVKEYREERELTVLFLVDVSGSCRFGSVSKLKNDVAAEVTALLAYSALKSNDKTGLIIFSDRIEYFLPPKKGRAHVWRVIRDILSFRATGKGTDIHTALEYLNRVAKKRAVVFLISDFIGNGYETLLKQTSMHHDLIAISIIDPREMDIPDVGYVVLEDAESGEPLLVNTSDSEVRENFRKYVQIAHKERDELFRSAGVDYIKIFTDREYVDPIEVFFKGRGKRRR